MVLERAGLNPATASDYELAHIFPLLIGGHSRKLDNLEQQPSDKTKRKDGIELKLQGVLEKSPLR